MAKEWNVVDVLRHYRHDWLNKLQLIKGNLDIGRVEKVHSLIEEVVHQSKHESHLTNMNVQQLAERLLTFNWEGHPYVLSFETLANRDWSQLEERTIEISSDLFKLFDQNAVVGSDNHLLLTMSDIAGFELEYDFHGQLHLNEQWEKQLDKLKEKYYSEIKQLEWNSNSCYIHLSLYI